MLIAKLKFKSVAPYSFTAPAGRNMFQFHIKYCVSDNSYYMDIDIMEDGKYKPIANSVSLSCGADIFIPFKSFGLGSMFVIPVDSRNYKDPIGPTPETILDKYIMVWEHD